MPAVIMVGAEAAPFAKCGGLGDVLGSLPQALRRQGAEVALILPKYQSIAEKYQRQMKFMHSFTVPVSWRTQHCGVYSLNHNGVNVYFLDNEYYFKRPYMYGFYDEAERYAFFARAVLEALPFLAIKPDILHCHDWHTGLVNVYLDAYYRQKAAYQKLRTVFTIHNLKYQGIFPKEIMDDLLGLGWEYFTFNRLEFFDQVNYMKGGLVFADCLTTVSPSYAEEIQTGFFGERLNMLLYSLRDKLHGILNGIDYDVYNPSTDRFIESNYDRYGPGKQRNKAALQVMLGLSVDPDIPVVAMVTRLVSQKGLDLVTCVFDEMMAAGIQFVVVGTGDFAYEEFFRQAAMRYPGRVAAAICFDETLSRKVYAGADLFLMPSLYEPCGIAQLIAMRYGTVPVVRETGGLKDTVRYYEEQSQTGNGFSFANYNAHDMLFTLWRALTLYRDKRHWAAVVNNAMSSQSDWNRSAEIYIRLYQNIADGVKQDAIYERNI